MPIREHHQHTTDEQRRPPPLNIQWKIPRSDWPTVLRLIDDGVSLRQIASYYDVSYETVRRIANIARQEGMGD